MLKNKENNVFDVVIIGAGPAGLCAALYLKRANVNCVIIEKGPYGGKINYTSIINNYLGINHAFGPDLAEVFYKHIKENKVPIIGAEIEKISKKEEYFVVHSNDEDYFARAIIICSGTTERKLELTNAEKFEHRGISYCAVCDGPLYRNKEVAVIGGGNSALEEALYLASIASKVHLIHRREEFRADGLLVEQVKNKENIELHLSRQVKGLLGDKSLIGVVLDDESELKVSALFPYIGQSPNTSFLDFSNICDEKGYIIVNSNMETEVAGLYACGDVTNQELKQIITACGDGAKAAYSVIKYLRR